MEQGYFRSSSEYLSLFGLKNVLIFVELSTICPFLHVIRLVIRLPEYCIAFKFYKPQVGTCEPQAIPGLVTA